MKLQDRYQLIPTMDLQMGADTILIDVNKDLSNQNSYRQFEIMRKRVILKPKKNYECDEENGQMYKKCLDKYIQDRMGCVLPWNPLKFDNFTEENPRICDQSSDSLRFENLTTNSLMGMSLEQIKSLTGCVNNCGYQMYQTKTNFEGDIGSKDMFSVGFTISRQELIVEQEVYTYDANNFIADVGGFLGLLLGMGLLNVYEMAVMTAETLVAKLRERRVRIEVS